MTNNQKDNLETLYPKLMNCNDYPRHAVKNHINAECFKSTATCILETSLY